MPSPASKQPPGAASTPVTRTPSRCGTGPVAASATTAGAAGGATTTTSSPPPSSDAHPLRYTHAAVSHLRGLKRGSFVIRFGAHHTYIRMGYGVGCTDHKILDSRPCRP